MGDEKWLCTERTIDVYEFILLRALRCSWYPKIQTVSGTPSEGEGEKKGVAMHSVRET